MSAKAIREYHGKKLLAKYVSECSNGIHEMDSRSILVTPESCDYEAFALSEPWLCTTPLVVKPDQLIKRRGKAGLVGIRLTYSEVQTWIAERMGKSWTMDGVTGILTHFIVEPFVPHSNDDEYYACLQSHRDTDEILFTNEGGVDVGNVDEKALRCMIGIQDEPTIEHIQTSLLTNIPKDRVESLASFIVTLMKVYRKLNFTYMEINPIVMTQEGTIIPLDLAAKLDETASFLQTSHWDGHADFPAPFGRAEYPEELFIRELDGKTGASLKLTILNRNGRIWTMVAGGGASVVYADTISDLGFGQELANYGEYSGAPSTEHTYEYAKTIISLMTSEKHPQGKILLIGGGIANFTDVAATFTGLIKAIVNFQDVLKSHKVSDLCTLLDTFINNRDIFIVSINLLIPNINHFYPYNLSHDAL
jgi:ATP citrate (pro-S)-lyase